MFTWFLLGILIGLFIRCTAKPHKSVEDKFKDPWNWTGFGGGIRFFMPMIGKLGFDFGYGFDDLNGDGQAEGWKSSITIGQQF